MARHHDPFTVFKRKLPSGEAIWYYRARNEDGTWTSSWSTGQDTKGAARAYCRKLEKAGKLIQPPSYGLAKLNLTPNPVTFDDLAKDFWTWAPPEDKTEGHTSEYITRTLEFGDPSRAKISERCCADNARIVENYLLPTFRHKHLDQITVEDIEAFGLRLRDGGLSGKRVNNIISCLRIMLGEAYRKKTFPWNPKEKGTIHAFGSAPQERGILTWKEAVVLFAEANIETAWKGHALYRAVNFVAAFSGMRQGEILAARDEDIRDGGILVSHSWNPKFGLGGTKTRKTRFVPLDPRVIEAVRPFVGNDGFVYSMSRGRPRAAATARLRRCTLPSMP